MEVAGGLSLSGEDWRPRSSNKLPRVSKAAANLAGISAPTEIVNVVTAVKAERAEHVRDRGGGALAHHSGRAEAKGGRDVEVEKTIVAETEVVVVAGIDAKLSVGAAEVFS